MSKSLYAALGSTSEYVTTEQNSPGRLTPALAISPESGVGLRITNRVEMGEKRGIPIYMKLVDVDGNPMPIDTEVAVGYEAPTDSNVQVVSDKLDTIQTYRKKDIDQQQDSNNIDSVKHILNAKALDVRDVDNAYILIDSDVEIDHAASEIYIEQSAVSEVDIE